MLSKYWKCLSSKLFFSKIVLAIRGPVRVHVNFRPHFPAFANYVFGVLTSLTLLLITLASS